MIWSQNEAGLTLVPPPRSSNHWTEPVGGELNIGEGGVNVRTQEVRRNKIRRLLHW